jgi:archaemetzincin
MRLHVYSEDAEIAGDIQRVIEEVYGLKVTTIGLSSSDYSKAYNAKRRQYDAFVLLQMIETKEADIFLLVLKYDIFCEGMNFIFGLASFHEGAVLSTFRLDSVQLIKKEAIHEIGHVLGLDHCKNNCVMSFSNSLSEANKKPIELCERCRRRIRILGYTSQ